MAGVLIVAVVIVGVEETKGTATYPINVVYRARPGSSRALPWTCWA